MKGRGSLQQQQGHGQSYFGARGGRGPPANNNHQRGNIPKIGACLDLSPRMDIAPRAVTKWMARLKEYAMTTYKSKISMIFGADDTLGKYHMYALPDQLDEEASVYERDIRKLDLTEHEKNLVKLDDKLNLDGAML